MSWTWIWDFIKGFWRARRETEEQNTSPIKWYKELDNWQTVWITEDKSWFEEAWDTIWNVTNAVQWWFSWIFWDKSDIDQELFWLKYDWQYQNWWVSDDYINMLSQYDYLNNKWSLTLEEALRRKQLDDELNKFTVAWEDSWIQKWYLSWMPDSWRNSLANNWWLFWLLKADNAEEKVDREKILWILNENPKAYKRYNSDIMTPAQIKQAAESDAIPTMTEKELKNYIDETKEWSYQAIYKNKLDELAKRAVKDKNFSITWAEWELITESDVMKLFNESLWRSWISNTLEAQAWAYDKLDDYIAPKIREIFKNNIESLMELQYYQFTHPEMSSAEAQMAYIKESWNDPFSLDFQNHYKEMNDYEKALVNWIDWLAWTVIPLWYAWYWLLWSTADAEAKARLMWRFINATNVDYSWWFWKDIYDFWARWFNWAMMWFQQVESLFSSILWLVWWISWVAADSIKSWELKIWDFVSYYYWFQTSKSFTTTETFQRFKQPQEWSSSTFNWVLDHYSMIDDIVEIILPAKWISLPTKFAKLEDVIKVVWKVDDTIDAVKWTSKIAKITKKTSAWVEDILSAEQRVEKWWSIVSDVQKATWEFTQSQKLWDRTKWAIKNISNKITSKRQAKKQLQWIVNEVSWMADIWNKWSLFMQNLWNWVAEEVITSVAYQSMVPYDYTYTDLMFDIWWAAWSWWLRSRQFFNQLWMVKFWAVTQDKIWWLRYIKEVNKTNSKEVKRILNAITEQDLSDIWTIVKTQMWDILWWFKEMTQEWFSKKIWTLSSEVRRSVDNNIDSFVQRSENDLINKLKLSSNKEWNSMVKQVKDKWKTKWVFNKPAKNASDKVWRDWDKKIEKAKRKAYSVWWLDWKSYVKRISNMRDYVNKHAEEMLWQSKKYRKYVEFKDWKRQFKASVSEEKRKNLKKMLLVKRLKQAWILIRSISSKYKKEYERLAQRSPVFASLYKLWIWDELENPIPSRWINLWQRLAMYVNDIIWKKYIDKAAMVSWLDNNWAMVSMTFKRWLNKYYDIADYNELTKKELWSKIIEFWRVFDAQIERQFMSEAKVFNENWVLKDNKDLLINQPFQDAIKENPDLKYMWLFLFWKIAWDTRIPEVWREIKLRTYKWDPSITWRFENEFYWVIKEWRHVDWFTWTKVFNDNFEEKQLMWNSWIIYVKLSKDSQAEAIKKVAGTDENIFDHRVNPNWEWVVKLIYQKQPVNFRRQTEEWYRLDWLQIYELRIETAEWRSLQAWWLNTYAQPIAKEWWDKNEIWWEQRFMNIVLKGDEFKDVDYNTVNFSLFRDTGKWTDPVLQLNDINKNVDMNDVAINDASFDPKNNDISQQTKSLKMWQDAVNFVYREADSDIKSWEKFTKLVPWRTDRIPYSYYAKVMSLPKTLAVWAPNPEKIFEFKKAQFNLLLDMMYNDAITHTQLWARIDMSWIKQFRTWPYNLSYKYSKRWKKWMSTERWVARIPSDWEVLINKQWWVVIVQKDHNWTPEVYTYQYREWSIDVFDLYKVDDVSFSKPAWEFSLWNNKLNWYIYDWNKNRVRILWSMEFENPIIKKWTEADIDFDAMIKKAVGVKEDAIKYSNLDILVKVEWAWYDDIHKAIFWEDISMNDYLWMRHIKWMTPERYFNQLLNSFSTSRFWRYFNIDRTKSWKAIADDIKLANKVIEDLEAFIKKFPEAWIDDSRLVEIWIEYRQRLIEWWMKFDLNKAEIEIRKMMFYNKWNNLKFEDFARLAWYRDYGIIPNSTTSRAYWLLRDRRDRILAYKLKTNDLWWLDDDLKDTIVERYFWDWSFFKTDEELLNDIITHPEEYRRILDSFADKYRDMFDSKKKIEKTTEILNNLDEYIAKLEKDIPVAKPKRVMWQKSKALKQYRREVLQGVLTSKIDLKRAELEELLEKYKLQTPDNPFTERDFNRVNQLRNEIVELEEWNRLYNSVKEYRSQIWQPNSITKEQWDEITRRSLTGWSSWYKPHEMSQAEINARLKQIKDRLPKNTKILNYDPETWTIKAEWLTDLEVQKVQWQLENIAENIKNWNVTAAHVREIHAIVINPKMLQEMDIWHEWFHEAISLVWFDWFDWRVRRVYTQARDKFRKEIEENAINLWYDKLYKWWDLKLTQQQYQDLITEEWLAERFAEFINWKYYKENEHFNSFIYQFFVELWDRIKTIFSDTEVVDLFEDIYKWLPDNDIYKVNFSAKNIDWWWAAYRSISKEWHDYVMSTFNNPNTKWLSFEFWDILWLDSPANNQLVEEQLKIIDGVFKNKWGAKDIMVLLWNDFTWRWNLLWMAKANITLSNWKQVRTSYMEIFEKITNTIKNIEVDNTLEKIYWWPQSELETWADEALKKLWLWSDSESLTWMLFNDQQSIRSTQVYDEYPITATLSKNDSWWINFKLDVNWVQIYEFWTNAENVWSIRSMISERLAYDEWAKKNITRLLDSYLAQRSNLVLWKMDIRDFAKRWPAISVWWELVNIDVAVEAMWNALWQSILDNYKIRYHESFDDFSPVFKVLADNMFQIYMYDRLIPHLWKSWLKRNIFDILFNKKNAETRRLIEFIQAYWKSNPKVWKMIDWKIWHDVNDKPVVQFIIDTKWYKRKIWWHLKSDNEALNILKELRADWRLTDNEFNAMYDTNKNTFKNKWLQSRSWNVSLLSLSNDDMTKYVTQPYIWKNFKQNYREWFNNVSAEPLQIRYRVRDIPYIDWSGKVWHKVIDIDTESKARIWVSDDELLDPKWFKQITFTSATKHMEDVKKIMDLNKKYGINLKQASPEARKKLSKMQYSKLQATREMKKSAKFRESIAELRRIKEYRSMIAKWQNRSIKALDNFQNTPIYKQIDRIRGVLEKNNDALKLIKNADVNPNTVSEAVEQHPRIIKQDSWLKDMIKIAEDSMIKQLEDMKANPSKYSRWRDVDDISKEKPVNLKSIDTKDWKSLIEDPEIRESDINATSASLTASTHICS